MFSKQFYWLWYSWELPVDTHLGYFVNENCWLFYKIKSLDLTEPTPWMCTSKKLTKTHKSIINTWIGVFLITLIVIFITPFIIESTRILPLVHTSSKIILSLNIYIQMSLFHAGCTLYTTYHSTCSQHKYRVHYVLYAVRYSLYTLHFTVYNIHCTLYNVHCTLYSVHCTLYTVYCVWLHSI